MIVKLLTERHLEFLSLKGGCTGSSESTLVKMSNCWNHMHWLNYNLHSQECLTVPMTEQSSEIDTVSFQIGSQL